MIIGISGKIGSGKDTVGKIIQYLTDGNEVIEGYYTWLHDYDIMKHTFNIKKFANKLKDIVCILLNCTREELEDHEFKNKELGEEWNIYINSLGKTITSKEYKAFNTNQKMLFVLKELTLRNLLQLIGTECGRNIIHPNIWVNSTMANYNSRWSRLDIWDTSKNEKTYSNTIEESKWIITDMRFPNELDAVKDRNGISIRVNRNISIQEQRVTQHTSETALDSATFNYTINNNGSINDLIKKVKIILEQENII